MRIPNWVVAGILAMVGGYALAGTSRVLVNPAGGSGEASTVTAPLTLTGADIACTGAGATSGGCLTRTAGNLVVDAGFVSNDGRFYSIDPFTLQIGAPGGASFYYTNANGWRITRADGTVMLVIDPITGVLTSAGGITTSNGLVLNGSGVNINTVGGYLAFNSTSTGGLLLSGITAASAGVTPGSAAFGVYPDNALGTNDYTFHVGNAANAATLFVVDYEGDTTATGMLTTSSYTDDSATTGNRTVNKVCGINAFAASATAITITNSYVTTTSVLNCTLQTNDATAALKNCTPAAGSFTATTAATTGITKLGWCVMTP